MTKRTSEEGGGQRADDRRRRSGSLRSGHGSHEDDQSNQMAGSWEESDEDSLASDDDLLASDGPSIDPALPRGAQMGDPAIWTPLPEEQDPEFLNPVVVTRSKRNIPKQITIIKEGLRSPNSSPKDWEEMRRSGLAVARLLGQGNGYISRPLTMFYFFKKLPTEMRMRVWKLASLERRIVALEFQPASPEDLDRVHPKIRACPASRVPALMHVNQESREEAMRLYERKIVFQMGGWIKDYVYVNPLVDILHLGGNHMCLKTYSRMLLMTRTRAHFLPRISIDTAGSECMCCCKERLPVGVTRAFVTLFTLHGAWGPAADGANGQIAYRRFSGLKEICLVVGSKFTHVQPQDIGITSRLRSATTYGHTLDQILYFIGLDSVISEIQKDFHHGGVMGDTWTGDKIPFFDFVSFVPSNKETDGRVVQMAIGQNLAIYQLRVAKKVFRYFSSLSRLQRQYKCKITMCDSDTQPHFAMENHGGEINIEGKKEDVENCRIDLLRILREVELSRINFYIQYRRTEWDRAMAVAWNLWRLLVIVCTLWLLGLLPTAWRCLVISVKISLLEITRVGRLGVKVARMVLMVMKWLWTLASTWRSRGIASLPLE